MTDDPKSTVEGQHDIAIQGAEEGAKATKKRRKQHHQEATTNDDNGPSAVHAVEAMSRGKRQSWPPTDHFKRLLEEACLTHAYTVKHKLRDYSLIKNFMATGSLSRGMEVDETPIKDDVTPFPVENAIMTIFERQPSLEKLHVLDLSTGTPSRYDHEWGDAGM
jgi:hypothetical protein